MRSLFVLLGVFLIGCLGDQPGHPNAFVPAGSDTMAASILSRADRTALDRAVRSLRKYDYQRVSRIEVSDEAGNLIMRYGYTTRFSGSPDQRTAEVRDTTLAGKGSAGLWEEYAGTPTAEDTLEWAERLLPKDPQVLSSPGRVYYRYSQLSDTTIGKSSVRRIEAELAPGTSRPGIQSGRFYVDTDTEALMGFDLIFAHQSLLFDEESHFRYLLQGSADEGLLPSEVNVNTFLNLPLTKGQRFRLGVRYTDPVPVGGNE